MEKATHAYLGYCGVCKLLVMATTDNPSHPRDTALAVSDVIRDGGFVTRHTLDECIAILCNVNGAGDWCLCETD